MYSAKYVTRSINKRIANIFIAYSKCCFCVEASVVLKRLFLDGMYLCTVNENVLYIVCYTCAQQK